MSNHPIVHIEFAAQDQEAAGKFYSDLFGWKIEALPEFHYYTFETGPDEVGGGINPVSESYPAGTVVFYVGADDLPATLKKAESLGDTASAVMAVPANCRPGVPPDWCYISSGTWSLMGVEVPEPVVTDACRQLNFTNEGGVGGTTRLLKNIAGLWLVQECRRIWKQSGNEYGWSHLVDLAERSTPLVSLINPDHADFVAPRDMVAAIREFCQRTGQPAPVTVGAVIRCALESLALRCRMVLGWLEQLIGGRIDTIHIVGGAR